MPKQPNDAVLSKDGTVKLNRMVIGVWWVDEYRWYHFALTERHEPVVSNIIRHEFKAAISNYMNEK